MALRVIPMPNVSSLWITVQPGVNVTKVGKVTDKSVQVIRTFSCLHCRRLISCFKWRCSYIRGGHICTLIKQVFHSIHCLILPAFETLPRFTRDSV